jgi:hypothetical protein
MTTRTFINAILITLLSASWVVGAPPRDAEARSIMVGSWVLPREQYGAVRKGGGFTFKRDGTFTSYGLFAQGNAQIRIEVRGKWSIKKGILTEEITASSHPDVVPVGLVTRDTLLAVTDNEYRSRTERGVVQWYSRK